METEMEAEAVVEMAVVVTMRMMEMVEMVREAAENSCKLGGRTDNGNRW
jgi:hypothetical protein